MLNHALLGQFADELYVVNNLDKRFSVYQKYISDLGFNGATYTFVPALLKELTPTLTPVFICTGEYPVEFIDQYQQQQLNKNDFTIRRVLAQNAPDFMDWRSHEKNGLVSEQEADLILLAREDYGINNALTIPMLYRDKGIGSVSIVSPEADANFQKLLDNNLHTVMRCTQLFHNLNLASPEQSMVFMKPLLDSLKPKELLILRHLASGHPLKTIGHGISYRYANNMLDDLRTRMGGITKDKLLYLIGHLHLLDAVD